jgi:hypothetical protein
MKLALLATCVALLGSACASRPPHMMAPFYNVDPGQVDVVEGSAWLVDPLEGDTYAVAGEDLQWRELAFIGPADDRTGRCSVDADGRVSFTAPNTPGEWPCMLLACRETCWVTRLTLVVLPAGSRAKPAPSE